MTDAQAIIEALDLKPHPEGGFFRRTYSSETVAPLGVGNSDRRLLSCIYYLLTSECPMGRLHVNRSDIVHFYQLGGPIEYTIVSPAGEIERIILGPEVGGSHNLQLTVPGGWWKASRLLSGAYGLVSEAVSPGFEYDDMRFVTLDEIESTHPTLADQLGPLCGNSSI